MIKFEKWFDKFEDTKEAQDFCFRNLNNYTRDHQVGEFCAKAAWDYLQENKNEKPLLDEWGRVEAALL